MSARLHEGALVPTDLEPLLARFDEGWPPTLEVGPGWHALLVDLDAGLSAVAPDYVVQQCKSKYGELRFYADPSRDGAVERGDFDAIIRDAEERSTHTCEECGSSPASQHTVTGWVRTLCPTHAPTPAST